MKLSQAERFVLLRKRLGKTQDQMCAILGICRKTLYRCEHGVGPVQTRTVERMESRWAILEARSRGR
jgi:DNA-binding XRE family transcriptional regulator